MTRIEKLRPAPATPPRSSRRPSGSGVGRGNRHLRRLFLETLEGRTLLASPEILNPLAMMSTPRSSPTPLAIPLGGGSPTPVGLTPNQVAQAYGFNAVGFQGAVVGDGTGQTIAIVDAYIDPNISGDLAAFDAAFSLPTASLTMQTVDGLNANAPGPGRTDAPWGQETALDVEWAHALAPGASILLVETPDTNQGLIDGVIYARSQPAVSVVSMSWSENSITSDQIFTTPAGHQGITFVAASGDDGSEASYPATSENVLAVGGTDFANPLDSNGDYPAAGEVAWSGSGGGVDASEAELPAQMLAIGNQGGRATPDVAFDAEASVAVYDSYDYGSTPWAAVFGTSIGAPAWSALMAIADQGLTVIGQPTLDGATLAIPDLYAIDKAGNLADGFNDITTGGNSIAQAGPGYDQVTGLGTPKADYIAATLSGDVDTLTLIAPAPLAVVGSTTPTFEWSTVAGAASYDLSVTDTITGQVITQNNLTGTSYTLTSSQILTAGDGFTWDVSAVTADGAVSPNAPAATPFAVLATPTPSMPSGIANSTTPAFQWSASSGAAGYNLQVIDTNTGQTVINTQVPTNSYTPSAPLINLHTYEWVVSAYTSATYNGIPFTTPQSGSAYFTVSVAQTPSLLSPPDQAAVVPPTTTLQWTSVPGAVSYTVTLLNPFGYPYASDTLTGTSWTTPSLSGVNSSANQYSWYVQANFDVGGVTTTGPASGRRTFALEDSAQPTLISPLPSATIGTAYPTLQWSAVSGYQYPYELSLLDITSDLSIISVFQYSGTSLPLGFPLTNGHTYEWSVTTNPGQVGTTGEFTVSLPGGGNTNLPAPTPTGPDGLINTTSPVFSWTPVAGATGYVLFYSADGETPDSLPEVTPYLSVRPYLNAGDGETFNWEVMAYDSAGDVSPISTALDFTVSLAQSGQLATPTNLSPSGVATFSNSPVFQWQAVAGAVDYFLKVIDETTGVTIVGTTTSGMTSYTPSGYVFGSPLIGGHQYRWYVTADGDSPAQESQAALAEFTYLAPAGDTPQPLSPVANTLVGTTTPTFSWSDVSGAAGYYLYISDPNTFFNQDDYFLNSVKVSGDSYTPTNPLLDAHAYSWQVSAYFHLNGTDVSGPTLSRTDFAVSVPGTPSLVANGGSGTLNTATPTLSWSAVAGAAGYDLYLTDTTTGAQVFNALPDVTTSFAVNTPLNNGDSYQWYVTAFDNVGEVSLAPPALNFLVSYNSGGLVPPTLQDPKDTGKTKNATPIFQWTPVSNAVGYSLTIQDTTTGKPVVTNLAVRGTTYIPSPPLPANDNYSWYVRAIYGNGSTGPKPDAFTFTVSPLFDLAGPPTPLSPAGPAGALPTFQWSAVANAVAYQIEVFATVNGVTFYPITPTTVTGTSFTPNAALPGGFTYTWQVAALDASGQETAYSTPLTFRVPSAASHSDFDGDGKSDIGIYDQTAAAFVVLESGGGSIIRGFGNPADVNIPVSGDFDGDGKADVGIYDQTASEFIILESGGGSIIRGFGNPADVNIPVSGDFDGDGQSDIGIYDQTASAFIVLESGGGSIIRGFGNPADVNIPVSGDFDGDGKSDVGIYDQTASAFIVLESGGGSIIRGFGNPADVNIPVSGDFDGDGQSDIGIYDQTASAFIVLESGGGSIIRGFGNPADVNIPVSGTGKPHVAVFPGSNSTFFVIPSSGSPAPAALPGLPPTPASSSVPGPSTLVTTSGTSPTGLSGRPNLSPSIEKVTHRAIPRVIPTALSTSLDQDASDPFLIRGSGRWLGRNLLASRPRS